MSKLIKKAKDIATKAHQGQVRKTDGSPYINHPLRVADILVANNFSAEIVAAGLVHDVVEDSSVTIDDIRKELGSGVADIVSVVSEDKSLEWEDRKKQYAENLTRSSEGVKAVVVADKIHNLRDLIVTHQIMGSAIWEKFNRGKDKKMWFEKTVLDSLKKSWNHPLVDEYEKLVEAMEELK